MALPGYFVAVALIDRLGPRWIQTQVRTDRIPSIDRRTLPVHSFARTPSRPRRNKPCVSQGFLLCALLYLVLACVGDRLIDGGLGGVALLLYGLSFFFFNFGPGATTYLYPSKLFPPKAKSTLNGLAAAAGKIGGFLGGALFPLFENDLPLVLGLCTGIAIMGAGITVWMLDDGDDGDMMKGRQQGGEDDAMVVVNGGQPLLDPLLVPTGGKEELEGEEEKEQQEGRGLNGDRVRLMRQRQLLASSMAAMSSSSSSSSLV